jgi:hypothetical protein
LTVDVFDLNDTALPVGSLGCVLDCVEVDGVGTPEDGDGSIVVFFPLYFLFSFTSSFFFFFLSSPSPCFFLF